jgi:hypothetical protein
MVRNYLQLGLVPADEPCPQVGSENYTKDAYEAGSRFIDLIVETHGNPPTSQWGHSVTETIGFWVATFPHDFGTYHEVVVGYDDQIEESIEYAFMVENNTPTTWEG